MRSCSTFSAAVLALVLTTPLQVAPEPSTTKDFTSSGSGSTSGSSGNNNNNNVVDRTIHKRLRQRRPDPPTPIHYEDDNDRQESERNTLSLYDNDSDFWNVYFDLTVSSSFDPNIVSSTGSPTTNPPTSTRKPTGDPTVSPTLKPSTAEDPSTTSLPTTSQPSYMPTSPKPTLSPTLSPSTPTLTLEPTPEPTGHPTEVPTVQPSLPPTTRNPTFLPTITPSRIPTDFPSKSPTKTPTNQPTNAPTLFPSHPPTQKPTQTPTQKPSTSPTNFPSFPPTGACSLDTRVTCEAQDPANDEEIISCQDLEPIEDLNCFSPIETLALRLDLGPCDDSLNAQSVTADFDNAGGFICTGEEEEGHPLPIDGREMVGVLCVDAAENVLHNSTLCNGDIFHLNISEGGGGGGGASSSNSATAITCQVLDINNSNKGTMLQEVTIDLSNDHSPLSLQNVFGSFQVVGCNSRQCMLPVLYTYTVVNDGSETADVNVFDRETSVSGKEDSVAFADVFDIKPGENTTIIEDGVVDQCSEDDYATSISVEATSSISEVSCPAEYTYEFSTSVTCLVAVEVVCTSSDDGMDCEDLETPPILCREMDEEPLTHLRFQYQPRSCNETSSTAHPGMHQETSSCFDFLELPSDEPVVIRCVAGDELYGVSDSVITVNPNTMVYPGDTLEVYSSDGGALPTEVHCVVKDVVGEGSNAYQEFSFATSNDEGAGEAKLKLKSRFGSLELEECSKMAGGGSVDCFKILDLTYRIYNIGTNDMDVTLLQRTTSNGITADLMDMLPDTTLSPGDYVQAAKQERINLCIEQQFSSEVYVEADPPNSLTCFGQGSFLFEVTPPCDVEVEISCRTLDGSKDCAEVAGEEFIECRCADACPQELIYRYTGATCDAGSIGCVDFTAHGGTVDITIKNEDRTYFEGRVQVDDDIILRNNQGDCVPDSFRVTVVSPSTSEISQIVTIDTSCEGSPTLLDEFGAFEFVGYTCSDMVPHNCHVEIEYEIKTRWVGTVDQTLESWTFALNDMEELASIALPVQSSSNQAVTVIPGEVDRCVDSQYTALSDVIGRGPSEQCGDSDQLSFDIIAGTRFPSPGPSLFPTSRPSEIPTDSPSSLPTEICEVDVSISCTLENGEGNDCSAIDSPSFLCREASDPKLDRLYFQIDNSECGDGSPTNNQMESSCKSFGTIPSDAAVNVECQSVFDDTVLDVIKSSLDGVILITSEDGSSLPAKISCSIIDSRGRTLQEVTFFSSNGSGGTNKLSLQDSFGALSLVGCAREDGKNLDCLQPIQYTYEIINVGASAMNITDTKLNQGGSTQSLQELLSATSLGPGEKGIVLEAQIINTCIEDSVVVELTAEAMSSSNQPCVGEDTYELNVNPPCKISVQAKCRQLDGSSCAELTGEPLVECICPDSCPSALIYRYTGASCNTDTDDCVQEGELGNVIMVEISSGDVTYFSGTVQTNDDILLRSTRGSCLPEAFNAVVSPVDASVPSQVVTIDSSCAIGGATLLDEFGAFLFAGYTCEDDGIPHNCFVDVEFEVTAFGTGVDLSTVSSSMAFDLSGSATESEVSFPSEDGLVATNKNELNLCITGQYSATVTVGATGEANYSQCTDETTLVFEITSGTTSPTQSPSNIPTGIPTATPSSAPSSSPFKSPSTSPSVSPTESPTESPTTSDESSAVSNPLPSGSPSESPSGSPNDTLIQTPGTSPPGAPNRAPSISPTLLPPLQPSPEFCKFDLETTCIPPPGSPSCNATPPAVEQCSGRPFEMIFLFNGGTCDQSFNVQGDQGLFICTDLKGGPPTDRNEYAYIVVTGTDGETVYHSDWVQVGSTFALSDGGNEFEANQLITIYESNNTNNPNNILQTMQYHSSCSSNLFLKDRFGAVQLVQWVNEDQGVISCFANQTFDLDVTIPIDIEGGPATLTSLTVASNVEPFFFNLTDQVAGRELDGGETLSFSIVIPLDLTTRKTYNLLITVESVTAAGQRCRAVDLQSFTAGDPLPPLFPTFAPTTLPTGTDPPTPDPETARCNLDADIECRTVTTGRSCRSISAPDSQVCDSDDGPNSLTFMYTGSSCLVGASTTSNGRCREVVSGSNLTQDEVIINIEGARGVVLVDNKVVGKGDTFELTSDGGGLGRDITVTISSIDTSTGNPGTELQSITRLRTRCRGQEGLDLTLLQDYGAIRLVGFDTNEQGRLSTTESIVVTYIIRNAGVLPAVLLSAIKESPFLTGSDPIDQSLIESSQNLEAGEEVTFLETASLNLEEAANSNTEYIFNLYITGEGLDSGVACLDSANYFFRID